MNTHNKIVRGEIKENKTKQKKNNYLRRRETRLIRVYTFYCFQGHQLEVNWIFFSNDRTGLCSEVQSNSERFALDPCT